MMEHKYNVISLLLVFILAASGNILSKYCNGEDHAEVESRFCPCCKPVDFLELPHDHTAHTEYSDQHSGGCIDIPIFSNAELTESSRTKIKDKGTLETQPDASWNVHQHTARRNVRRSTDPPLLYDHTATDVILI